VKYTNTTIQIQTNWTVETVRDFVLSTEMKKSENDIMIRATTNDILIIK